MMVFISPTKTSSKSEKVILEKAVVDILSTSSPDATQSPDTFSMNPYFTPDFGLGVGVEIAELGIKECAFSYHVDQVGKSSKFDPAHIDLTELNINAIDLLLSLDSLSAVIKDLSATLPGLPVSKAVAEVRMDRHHLNISGLHVIAGENEIQADVNSWFEETPTPGYATPGIKMNAKASINPGDFAYVLSDEIMAYFKGWEQTEFSLTGDYILGKGNVTTLDLKTSNSQIMATGKVNDLFDAERISWQDLDINTVVGADFRNALAPFLEDIQLPPSLSLQMRSTGSPNQMLLDGKINSTWGNLDVKGSVRPVNDDIDLDVILTGQNVSAGKFIDLPWLGNVNLTLNAKGRVGDNQDLAVNGLINVINVMDHRIHDITYDGRVLKDSVIATISIKDPDYRTEAKTNISFAEPMLINADAQLTEVKLGNLLGLDSSLTFSGILTSKLNLGETSMEGFVNGHSFLIKNQYTEYRLDTLALDALISPEASHINYFTDGNQSSLTANFDLQELPVIIENRIKKAFHATTDKGQVRGNRELQFDIHISNAGPFLLMGFPVDRFSGLKIAGEMNEQQQTFTLKASTENLMAYGVSTDSIVFNLKARNDSLSASVLADNVWYDSIQLGNLDFDAITDGDSAISSIQLVKDTLLLLGLKALVIPADSAVFVYPLEMAALGKEYSIEKQSHVYFNKGNMAFDDFSMAHEAMRLNLKGDMNAFEADFTDLDLTTLNVVLFPGEEVINHGSLSGLAVYKRGENLDFKAEVDSLIIYGSIPLSVSLTAASKENRVPFQFLLSNTNNSVDVHGEYYLDTKKTDAALALDLENLEMFTFLVSDVLDEMKGQLKGEATVRGTLTDPEVKGQLHFINVGITTANPKISFSIEDDVLTFDGSKLVIDNFEVYDRRHHPLTVSGYLERKGVEAYAYDLKFETKNFTLLDVPPSSKGQVKGLMVLAADIGISGDQKDTYVKADITIKDTTSLVYEFKDEDVDMLKTEGIVEFVDPELLLDSTTQAQEITFYDSLVNSLPEFTLKATLKIEDSASVRVITNAVSGDYFKVTGGAKLEMDYGRTGNAAMSGTYTIHSGMYRVSFYDLVKKNFQMVPGSNVKWSGSPETGEIDITAKHIVASNSIGLVGQEVGENEKAIYKHSLDYEVGISIRGTVEKPIVSFTLDLPQKDRSSYPVLANKLDRLKLPEFQTELNKQVFGLLVLGGFLPESTGSEVNSSQVATTALYNSVNSLLASQLNRFAGQYVKGVNIDVGIQSYADYSTPGGKTQTAMDFHVSKSILNDRLSFEVGGDFDINSDQSGANTGNNYRGDVAIIYDLTGNNDKQLKLFNNETYDIIYQEIRNTGISLVFIREFDKGEKIKRKDK